MKRTCPAKNRANFDIIESFFQEDPCMDLASRLIWSWQNSMEAVFLSNHKVQFWISVIWQVFSFGSNEKSLCRFFCQIIMGIPLNNNVSKGRSVGWCRKFRYYKPWWYAKSSSSMTQKTCRMTKILRIISAEFTSISDFCLCLWAYLR